MVSHEAYEAALRVAFSAAASVAERHRNRLLNMPNVIDVRAGYKFSNGWITDTPAVVVTVLRKDAPHTLGSSLLPTELDGVPVDVAAATPLQQLRHKSERTRAAIPAQIADAQPPEELLEPGQTPTVGASTGDTRGVNNRQYRPPTNLKLAAVTGPMTLLCHASPDSGWPTLQKFLGGTKKSLTVAMYDFGAKHIVAAILSAMKGAAGEFILNLDRRSNPKRTGELTEEEVVQKFSSALRKRFVSSSAAVGVLYPNAYHIKVAVQDGKRLWISSGNWQGSNQPHEDAAKLDESGQRKLFSGHNREWHVVCDNSTLAALFEGFIKFDVAEAARIGARAVAPPSLPDLVVPASAEAEATRAALRPVKVFPATPIRLTDRHKVQPILTPDNYGEHVVPLILSAKKRLWFQNQYIKIPKVFPDGDGKPALKELAEALLDRVNADIDVRIILRNGGDTRAMLQALKAFGVPDQCIKLLGGCHNKGIIVDNSAVLVSSQNYSADGVRFNRDAGLIIRNPDAVKYYADIFDHDWTNRATQRIAGEATGEMPLVREVANEVGARSAAATISWEDFYGD
jgi:hypothetical protein